MGVSGAFARPERLGGGAALLADAIARSLNGADAIGSKAPVVDPASDSARDFYTKHGVARSPARTACSCRSGCREPGDVAFVLASEHVGMVGSHATLRSGAPNRNLA